MTSLNQTVEAKKQSLEDLERQQNELERRLRETEERLARAGNVRRVAPGGSSRPGAARDMSDVRVDRPSPLSQRDETPSYRPRTEDRRNDYSRDGLTTNNRSGYSTGSGGGYNRTDAEETTKGMPGAMPLTPGSEYVLVDRSRHGQGQYGSEKGQLHGQSVRS